MPEDHRYCRDTTNNILYVGIIGKIYKNLIFDFIPPPPTTLINIVLFFGLANFGTVFVTKYNYVELIIIPENINAKQYHSTVKQLVLFY